MRVDGRRRLMPCGPIALVLGLALACAAGGPVPAERSEAGLSTSAAPPPEAAAPAVKAGDLVFAADFEDAQALRAWSGSPRTDAGREGGRAVVVTCADAASAAAVTVPLPAAHLRGCKIIFSAYVKAEKVSDRPQPWNGVKFMAPIDSPSGRLWPQGAIPVGTFGWRRVVWQAFVPEDATVMTLVLGLERVTGTVWFDDVRVVVRRPPIVRRPRPAAAGPVYTGRDLPRLRGAMVSCDPTREDLRVLGRLWNANLIRWQLTGWQPPAERTALEAYDGFLESHLKRLDAALPWCEEYGLRVVVDLHAAPTGPPGSGRGLFNDAACQEKFVEVWRKMARRYKDSKAVWAYDLLNEPVEDAVDEAVDDWQALAARAARAVREIDPGHAILVEPAQGGGPDGLRELVPLDVPGVVYRVHMYLPGAVTHQGVFDEGARKWAYPGRIDGVDWDKARLEQALRPVRDFQDAYGVHIYIGEFSAIRWAPDGSAFRYLRDLIDLFEARGWDWSYHAFREWSGWSVEHGPDKADAEPARTPTDRETLLRDWFARNRKPAG